MARGDWRCRCTALNAAEHETCEACGTERPRRRKGEDDEPGPALCPLDGGRLHADGFCPIGQGWPYGSTCPDVCPLCRHPLDWSGGCQACHGCTTGNRDDWTFPGYRYEVAAFCPRCRAEPTLSYLGAGLLICPHDKEPLVSLQHWRRDESLRPGRPANTRADNVAGAKRVRAILAGGPVGGPGERTRAEQEGTQP